MEIKMKFDKSKVYSALNADEVPIGSVGFVSNNMLELKDKVSRSDSFIPVSVTKILSDAFIGRFIVDNDTGNYPLFYLLKKSKKSKKRYYPYLNTDEMIFDFKKRFNHSVDIVPLIWIENTAGDKQLITSFNDDSVLISGQAPISMDTLFNLYKYINNSPCGRLIEEEDDE